MQEGKGDSSDAGAGIAKRMAVVGSVSASRGSEAIVSKVRGLNPFTQASGKAVACPPRRAVVGRPPRAVDLSNKKQILKIDCIAHATLADELLVEIIKGHTTHHVSPASCLLTPRLIYKQPPLSTGHSSTRLTSARPLSRQHKLSAAKDVDSAVQHVLVHR
jgi:hypothetical protein